MPCSKSYDPLTELLALARPIQRDITGWRDRITVMTLDSERANHSTREDDSTGECCGGPENGNCCTSSAIGCSGSQTIPFFVFLCFSCQVDPRDYRNGQFELPPYVAEVIKTKERDERLRQQVQEF